MYGVKAVTEKNQGEAIDALIGQRVRQQREALGLSIRGLAAMADIMSDTGKAMGPGKLNSLEKAWPPGLRSVSAASRFANSRATCPFPPTK